MKKKTQSRIVLAVIAIALVPVAILGLVVYTVATAETLHPDPLAAPSSLHSAVPGEWVDAAKKGQDIVRAGLSEQNLPGLSVAVGVNGQLVWSEGFGWADLQGKSQITPDTRFRIGTASVALTSAAVGLLLEKGSLKLDEEIQATVPEFPRKPWPVTLRALMGHTAGVRNDGGDEGPLYTKQCETAVEGLEPFKDRELLFEPGTQFRYSSYGWILASAAVESAARMPFLSFVQQQILDPVGMRDTGPDSLTERIPNLTTIYFPRFAADPRYGLHLMRPVNYSCYSGASVFVSTPSDLVRFGMAMNGGQLLKPETVRALQTPQRLRSGADTGYGLGWDVETVVLAGNQEVWTGHEGTSLGGPVASLVTFPAHGLVIAVLSNISYADTESVAMKIAEAFAKK